MSVTNTTFMHTKEIYFTFTERHRSTWIIVHIFINAFRKEVHMRQTTLKTLENRHDLYNRKYKPTSSISTEAPTILFGKTLFGGKINFKTK